jgi:nitrous oxidase accessory protein
MRTAPLILMLLAPVAADARTWTVGRAGADFPLIAPAIRAADPGDEIHVAPGVYREDLVVDKPLRIVAAGGHNGPNGGPILIGSGLGTVVTISAPRSELSRFTIEGSGTGMTNAMDAAVLVTASGVRVTHNDMRRVFYGVVVSGASDTEVTDNRIEGFADLPFGRRGDGIYVYRSPRTLVARNTITGERDAIYYQYSPLGRVAGNRVSGSRYGLHDMFSDDTHVSANRFADSSVGANIMNSRRILVERNEFIRNRGVPGIGLTLKDCDAATVRGNRLTANARALLVDGSSSNQFTGNLLRDNDAAIVLFSSAERNTFRANSFIDNWSDLLLSGRDSGTVWSGNHWSRYRGFDFDGDGTGDAPHPILGTFERIEGSNPAARIFLRSPAAAGLELAARLGVTPPADAVDPDPRVVRDRASTGSSLGNSTLAGLTALLAAIVITRASQMQHAASGFRLRGRFQSSMLRRRTAVASAEAVTRTRGLTPCSR